MEFLREFGLEPRNSIQVFLQELLKSFQNKLMKGPVQKILEDSQEKLLKISEIAPAWFVGINFWRISHKQLLDDFQKKLLEDFQNYRLKDLHNERQEGSKT